VGVSYKAGPAFNASLNYAPEINFFHSTPGEDYIYNRTGVSVSGKVNKTKWEVTDDFIWIDGSKTGPSFFGPGGAPAGGGPQLRDRHAALLERGQFRLTQTMGDWFVRPVVSGNYQDFLTDQKTTPGYQNYVDRNDLNGGLDIGYAVAKETWVVAGYRYGVQNQATLFNNPVHYDSTYNRALVGVEGKPSDWLKLCISAGPEFRHYGPDVAPGFGNRDVVYAFADATATITPTKKDTLALSAKRFEQPGFSGRSTYIDSTYEMTWRHKLTDKLTLGAGVRGYNTDFRFPTLRNDWIVSPSGVISYSFTERFSGELSYVYDDAMSEIPDTRGREYTHNLVALGLRYVFK
jgi:hypothetical protein